MGEAAVDMHSQRVCSVISQLEFDLVFTVKYSGGRGFSSSFPLNRLHFRPSETSRVESWLCLLPLSQSVSGTVSSVGRTPGAGPPRLLSGPSRLSS